MHSLDMQISSSLPFSTTCHTIRASKWIVQKMEDRLCNNKHLDAQISYILIYLYFWNYHTIQLYLDYIYFYRTNIFNYPISFKFNVDTQYGNVEYTSWIFPLQFIFIFSLKALKIRRWFMYYIISQRNWFFTSIHLTGLSRAKFARIFNFSYLTVPTATFQLIKYNIKDFLMNLMMED